MLASTSPLSLRLVIPGRLNQTPCADTAIGMLASDGFALNCAGLRYASVPPSNEFPAMASVMPLPEPPPAGARVIFGDAVVSGATSSCRNGSSSDDPLSLNVTAVVGLP